MLKLEVVWTTLDNPLKNILELVDLGLVVLKLTFFSTNQLFEGKLYLLAT